ncbi:hypothetical protein QN347_20390, partial [Sphingomonas sp. 10B4]|nr:hypothetical protein [Sphingomonas sp. 10B4]
DVYKRQPLILSSADLVYRSSVLNTLARGAPGATFSAPRSICRAPRIAALCGVVAAGFLIARGAPRPP